MRKRNLLLLLLGSLVPGTGAGGGGKPGMPVVATFSLSLIHI